MSLNTTQPFSVGRIDKGFVKYLAKQGRGERLACPCLKYQDVPKSEEDCRLKLREYFYKNACVKDVRVIDILVIKGYMELKEQTHQWQAKGHVMAYWSPTVEPKPCGFIGKFLAGVD